LYISMRAAVAVLLLAALALALQIGQLNFVEVTSAQSFADALKPGPVLIYIHQPNCPDCEYLEAQVFTDGRVASALGGVHLVFIDISKYFVRSISAVADGRVYIYYGDSLSEVKAYGNQTIPIIGTPTTIMGYVENGTLHVTFVMIGAADPNTFLRFLGIAYGRQASAQQTAMGGGPQALAQIALSFAAGAASVFSPCVLPVLTIAATTYLARRRLAAVLAGMVASYAAIATAVSAAAAWAGEAASTALYAVGGVLLVAMGAVLVVERLNRSYAVWASRLQTSAYRASRRGVGRIGDFMLGASLGAVWAPCIAPFFGAVVVANLAASALTGDYLLLFASTLTYAGGLALVVYLLITAVRRGAGRAARTIKWSSLGRRIEYAVGILSIVLGILLVGEALGLGTFSLLFRL